MDRGTQLLLHVAAGGTLGFTLLCSIPAISSLFRKRTPKNDKVDHEYEDEDGTSTPEDVAKFSNKVSKIFVLLFAGLGCFASIFLSVLDSLPAARPGLVVDSWLYTAVWVLLGFNAICVAMSRRSTRAFELGIWANFPTLVLFVTTLHRESVKIMWMIGLDMVSVLLRILFLVAVIGLSFSAISLPRRPPVYYNGRQVDKRRTVSALGRFTFQWSFDLLSIARKKKDLDITDFPMLDQYGRSAQKSKEWDEYNFTVPLWRSLIWTFRGRLVAQWVMSTAKGATGFLPAWWTLKFLEIIERSTGEQHWPLEIWFVVLALVLSIFLHSALESWMYWVSWGEISVPVRAQLSSIIFEKSLRRKNVKAAKKADEKPADSEVVDGETGESETTPLIGNGSKTDTKKDKGKGKGKGKGKDDDDDDDEAEQDTGELKSRQAVVNLIGVDTFRISMFAGFQFVIPECVSRLVVSLLFLVHLLGWIPMLAGLLAWVVILPINMYFTKMYTKAQDRMMKARDQKLEVVNESLSGARQIKFSALEEQWEKRILGTRNKELKAIWKVFIGDTALYGCWVVSPIASAAASLSAYAILNGELTPAVAFIGVSVFKSLEMALTIVPELITDVVDSWISCKRIGQYLDGPEITPVVSEGPEVAFKDASIAWPVDAETADEDRFILRNVNLTFPTGELSIISGKTGTGKSLVLSALIGEVDLLDGKVFAPAPPSLTDRHDYKANRDNWIIPGAKAYVAQIPWIENASLKDNVLFGLPLDEERYNKTIEVCALKKDLDMLTDGDRTELGTNGINISGGQKWRVTLARAVYSRAGILIFDDIFSAVDAHVGRHIFEKCLTGELCNGRTRIVVTHHVALCQPKTKYLVELGDGTVQHAGFIEELQEDGTLDAIKSHEQSQREIEEDEDPTAVNSEVISDSGGDNADGQPLKPVSSKTTPPKQFVEDEAREKGAIKSMVYAAYFKSSGGFFVWALAGALFLVNQSLTVGRSYWLKLWTETPEDKVHPMHYANALVVQMHLLDGSHSYSHSHSNASMEANVTKEKGDLYYYLGIFVAISVASAFIGTLRFFYTYRLSIKASKRLFEDMTFTVLRAPLRWLDTVPVGRILNRFTADFNTIDTRLANTMMMMVNTTLAVVGICVATNLGSPWIIVPAIPLLAGCTWVGLFYLEGARPSKRLESNAKSPVFDLFGSTLAGVTTIRGFDKAPAYVEKMFGTIDNYSVATYYIWLLNRWMGWWMLIMGMLYTGAAAVLILLSENMNAALAGFTMSFALEFSNAVLWVVRCYANIELDMNATERVIEYTKLKTEDLGGEKPPAAWPTEGRLEVHDLVVGYADDLPPVLKGLSFTVNRNERVGVVGRTGAGKSSLTLALFRFLEARSGSIYIDGLDISKINLHELRSRLAIIPQDPVLFSGTIRSNLDPFDDRTDAELRDSLARVHLLDSSPSPTPTASGTASPTAKNANIFRSLSSPISEGGGNLSQGQRQLLCLARAIVSRPKVMVLDEATSAVDMHTDTLIQRSIREEFTDSTLVVIAHRLSTIADFDRILVLSDGKVDEFGSPRELWEKGGAFRGMCDQSGEPDKLEGIIFGKK